MIRELNRKMRAVILTAGALLVVLKVLGGGDNTAGKADKNAGQKFGATGDFQTEEFDDIW